MIKLKDILYEVFDMGDSYPFKHSFKTELEDEEDEETGETYKKDVLSNLQIIKFKSSNGIQYVWYAKNDVHDNSFWRIAFGVYEGGDGTKENGSLKLNIEKTGTGDAFRVLATVIEITNTFVEFDENNEIQRLHFESEGDNRTNLYLKRLVPRIDNFKVEHVSKSGTHSDVTLVRTN